MLEKIPVAGRHLLVHSVLCMLFILFQKTLFSSILSLTNLAAALLPLVPQTILLHRQYIFFYVLYCFHSNPVSAATFDRMGRYVITGSDDRLVKIWAMETAFCLASCRGHEVSFTYFGFVAYI